MEFFCYILSNKNRTVLYVGKTRDLRTRLQQHKKGVGAVFTKKYNCYELLYFETFKTGSEAWQREQQLKRWHKDWKWNLIKDKNPDLKEIKIETKKLAIDANNMKYNGSKDPETSSGLRIIPAIDIIEGKCVRLSKGDYNTKKIYNESPLEVAKEFEAHGIQYLHLVDLDGAKSKHIVNHKVLEQIASQTSLKIDFGGGLKTDDDLRIAFESGANQITGGSIAVKDPETFKSWLTKFGAEKIILGADAKDEKVAVSGWLEESKEELIPFIQSYQKEGVSYVICTDISKDGMLEGPSFDLYRKILEECHPELVEGEVGNLKLIASGGISTFDELPKLAELGCEGTIIGKAIYEGRISMKQLEGYISNN